MLFNLWFGHLERNGTTILLLVALTLSHWDISWETFKELELNLSQSLLQKHQWPFTEASTCVLGRLCNISKLWTGTTRWAYQGSRDACKTKKRLEATPNYQKVIILYLRSVQSFSSSLGKASKTILFLTIQSTTHSMSLRTWFWMTGANSKSWALMRRNTTVLN